MPIVAPAAKEKGFRMRDALQAAMFRSFVADVGGVDAAAAAIEAGTGAAISRGSVSKVCHGQMALPLGWAHALEDATGNFAFTRARTRHLEAGGVLGPGTAGTAVLCHLRTMRESHEAVLAQAAAEGSADVVVLAQALKETLDIMRCAEEAEAVLRDRLARLGLEGGE